MNTLSFDKWFSKQSQKSLQTTNYYQKFVVKEKKSQKIGYAYKLKGIAKIKMSLYQKYRILSPFTQDQQRQQVNNKKPNSLLVMFLVKVWKILTNIYKLSNEQIFFQLFGNNISQKELQVQHNELQAKYFETLINLAKRNYQKTYQQIKKQYCQSDYDKNNPKQKSHYKKYYQMTIVNNLQIIPKNQKIERLKVLEDHPLWQFNIFCDKTQEYIIVNFQWQKTQNKIQQSKKRVQNLSKIDNLQNIIEENIKQSKQISVKEIRKLGYWLCSQLIIYQNHIKFKKKKFMSQYKWIQPKNILVNSQKSHLSHEPLILYCLGLDKQPKSILMKLTQLTAKSINYYKAPQEISSTDFEQNYPKITSWKIFLLLYHYVNSSHLYQQCQNQSSMKEKFQNFSEQISKINKNGQQYSFIRMMINIIGNKINWINADQRPSISDIKYFMCMQKQLFNNDISFKTYLKQYDIICFKKTLIKNIEMLFSFQYNQRLKAIVKFKFLYYIQVSKLALILQQLMCKQCRQRFKRYSEIQQIQAQLKRRQYLLKQQTEQNNLQQKKEQQQLNRISKIKQLKEKIQKQNAQQKYFNLVNNAVKYAVSFFVQEVQNKNFVTKNQQKLIYMKLQILKNINEQNYQEMLGIDQQFQADIQNIDDNNNQYSKRMSKIISLNKAKNKQKNIKVQ